MIRMNLQLFGGRSSAGDRAKSNATKAAEPKATEASANSDNQTFASKDLRAGYDRYPEKVVEYSKSMLKTLKVGDSVTISKEFKDGTTKSATFKITEFPKSESESYVKTYGREFRYTRTGDKLSNMSDLNEKSGEDNSFLFTHLVAADKSKVKNVSISVTRKGTRKKK